MYVWVRCFNWLCKGFCDSLYFNVTSSTSVFGKIVCHIWENNPRFTYIINLLCFAILPADNKAYMLVKYLYIHFLSKLVKLFEREEVTNIHKIFDAIILSMMRSNYWVCLLATLPCFEHPTDNYVIMHSRCPGYLKMDVVFLILIQSEQNHGKDLVMLQTRKWFCFFICLIDYFV